MSQSTHGENSHDVVDVLTWDHEEMIELLGQVEGASAARRRELVDTVIAEVMRHAVAEEMFVYPAIEEHLPKGAEKVEQDKQEHQQIIETMKELEDLDPDDAAFLAGVRNLEAQLRSHAAQEETDQFPQLRAHIPRQKLAEIANKVQSAKKLSPTRPHPHAPHSKMFHKSIGRGVGMIDRLRDSLTGRNVD